MATHQTGEREYPVEPSTGKAFSYQTSRGTTFQCSSLNLSDEIRVADYPREPELLAVEVAEMIAHHAMEVWPSLNGFAGYDALRFKLT